MNWYVLQVKTGDEIAIRNNYLKREIKALVPRQIICERRQGKFRQVERNLFPSYVFVYLNFEPKVYYQLKQTSGVLRFLGADGPQPVPEEEMRYIFALCGDSELAGISTVVKAGDKIKVLAGPLQGFEGQIVRMDYRHLRARVKLTLFNRPHVIDLGIEVLETNQQSEVSL
jgi:transcriptional antiterminator NusG